MQTIVEILAKNTETGLVHCFKGNSLKEAIQKTATHCAEHPQIKFQPLNEKNVKIFYNWDITKEQSLELNNWATEVAEEAKNNFVRREKEIDNLFSEFKTRADNIGLTTELISVSDRFYNNRIVTKKP